MRKRTALLKKLFSGCAAAAVFAVCSSFPMESFGSTENTDLHDAADEIVILVNEARTEAGLEPVYAVPVLYEVSDLRARECVELFSHYRPDSTLFNTALDEFGVSYAKTAENVAAGNSTPKATFEQWANSPSHWNAIMNEAYTHIGVGVYYDPESECGWYWEQIFIASAEELKGQYIPQREESFAVTCGDIDGDGAVTVFDYVLLVKRLQRQMTFSEQQNEAADCLKDGDITISDAVVLKKYLLNSYNTLPVIP